MDMDIMSVVSYFGDSYVPYGVFANRDWIDKHYDILLVSVEILDRLGMVHALNTVPDSRTARATEQTDMDLMIVYLVLATVTNRL
eukprot:6742028-Pyramimonas_sp.AAC.1